MTSILVPEAARHAPRASLARRLVLAALSHMTRGRLELTLPDGAHLRIGETGATPHATIRVHREAFFTKCVRYGDVGFGESYVDGDWDTDDIAAVIRWAVANVDRAPTLSGSRVRSGLTNLLGAVNRLTHRLRANTRDGSRRNIAAHYDLGNDFYALWLDPSMTYSSAKFVTPGQSLEEAQAVKYEALCRKARLRPGQSVLEIGTGWGGFAVHAARHHGVRVTTITVSAAQATYARDRVTREGLAHLVDVRLCDYRDITGRFDRIVSIEMMEALGDRFLPTYTAALERLLAPDGLVALQYITVPDARHAELRRGVDWIQKHIFPGSLLLSVGRVSGAMERTGTLFLHDLEDLGASYARTLHCWWERFNAQLPAVRALGFDERFIRAWNYYLQYCEAAFTTRNISVVQAIYTRPNNPELHVAW